MSLRYALLALLTAQPMTGYDLAKAFHVSVGHVWHAPDSQIYPELKRMVADGVIEGEAVAWGPKSTKTRYSISAAGIEAFTRWLDEPVEYPYDRDPAHLRAAYFEWADPDSARARLREHIVHYTERRAQWQGQLDAIRDRTHPILARRIQTDTRHSAEAIAAFKEFTYEGFVERADQEIAWARRGLALVDALQPGGAEPDRG
ncbi:PadR family transcriptional regulator [Microbacterium sp. X-17]|uniref:PadR family transcriptional regulator n=1 Tax=Microbacterium sp. X-17 TaxID=3144404 RepID=UPI0031F486F2